MACNLKTKQQIAKDKLACVQNRTIKKKWNSKTCTCERVSTKKNISTGDRGFYKKDKTPNNDGAFYKKDKTPNNDGAFYKY